MIMEAMGVPTGWDDEPVTGTGMCQTEITKTTAPNRPILGRYTGSSLMRLLIIRRPRAINMADIANQKKTHSGLRIPSEMCILAS
jgi:hypothetical protein